jgi:hypothetical protein
MRPARLWPGPGTFPVSPLGPRCGRVLILDGRHERTGDYGDPFDPPTCARPAGNAPAANGSPGCRSAAAIARDLRAGVDRRRRARMRAAA